MASPDNEAFLKRLLATFRIEADEHVRTMASLLDELGGPDAAGRASELVENLFREAHSLKGAARAVNLGEIETSCSALEDMLAAAKRHEIPVSPELLTTLEHRLDEVGRLLAPDDASGARPGTATAAPRPERSADASGAAPGTAVQSPPLQSPPPLPAPAGGDVRETVRIATARLATLLVRAEEFVACRFAGAEVAAELQLICSEVEGWRKTSEAIGREVRSLRRKGGRSSGAALPEEVDTLLAAIERDEDFVRSLDNRLERLLTLARQQQHALGSTVESFQEDVKDALMQPFSVLFELLPKLMRDLARDCGKEVEVRLEGGMIEIDRRILEQIKDPIIHLARNAIAHGIEASAERMRRGKSPMGVVGVAVAPHEGNRVEIVMSDDGAGIDLDRVKQAAINVGLVSAAEAARLGHEEARALVFASGVSTSAALTEIAGRGLGLAIVREKVDKLGGSIAIEEPALGGTRFRIVLPTRLANFRGLLVAIGDRQFVLPAESVERVARVPRGSVRSIENREAVELDGQAVALARLGEVLGMPAKEAAAGGGQQLPLAVLTQGDRRIAFAVDAVLGDQEVLVKGLGPQLRRVRNIAGATVIGAGRIVPLLNVPDLFRSALRAPPTRARESEPVGATPERRLSLLVVDDSPTLRALLKNILDSAGHEVTTAVDGVEALDFLRRQAFDLVVSDVEMPRMGGFDLTARIRQDPVLSELPVVLLTALGSPADKERGIDVGASAYLVKAGFDQSRLLEVIRRLT